jgi:2-hydroxychromene-2-carboxylate isomerase
MTLSFDCYLSLRSPYSYLAIDRIRQLAATHDVEVRPRIILPLAVRVPSFFKNANPMFGPYLMRDTKRVAESLGLPYAWPVPDPIVMDHATREVAAEQPYIHRVSRLGIAGLEAGGGLDYLAAVYRTIWSGAIENWHSGDHLARAARECGLDPSALERVIRVDSARLDAVLAQNAAEHNRAGHWGVPLFVFEGEPFFGQDRIDLLVWRMRQRGLEKRAPA